ncbi:hypothetical protein CYMTET_5083 [Cymbomonas tetramitiformis]|uniref:Uncharacterized protein n=1 Tax=Cymbomonas tetramitiformis TaxID=36881 RepID=A0AAE0GZW9_9CHLO|nr:hypothetical protein CYMTET_5083 [Cymbomonas tetramitiformis]
MSSDRISLGSRLRPEAQPRGDFPWHHPARESPWGPVSGPNRAHVVITSTRPTPIFRAATSVEFHNDSSVWVSTPVRASQRSEFVDKLDYAFSYGEELAKLLRAHDFKANSTKLLDLDFEYAEYHLTLNELIYVVLPIVLRGTALSLYYEESAYVYPHDGRCALQRLRYHVEGIGDPDTHRFWVRLRAVVIDETIEPAPQLAVFRTLADKHRKLHPDYGDRNLVEDLHTVLRSSAALCPYATPLYLVVICDINDGHRFSYAALALRLAKVFRDEAPLARLAAPPSAASGGGGRSGGGKAPAGAALALGKRRFAPPVGEWKRQESGDRYLVWEGTGMPGVTCFRL